MLYQIEVLYEGKIYTSIAQEFNTSLDELQEQLNSLLLEDFFSVKTNEGTQTFITEKVERVEIKEV